MSNLSGNLNLKKLNKVGVVTLKGVKCVVIPIGFNDIYVKTNDQTGEVTHLCLPVNIWEKRETDRYGNTHTIKPAPSKDFKEMADPEFVDGLKNCYLGDLKPNNFQGSSNEASTVKAEEAIPEPGDDLPF